MKQYTNACAKKGRQSCRFRAGTRGNIVITGHAGEGAVPWLKGYGIDVRLVAASSYTAQDAIEASQLSLVTSALC